MQTTVHGARNSILLGLGVGLHVCHGERSFIALMVDFQRLLPAISTMEDISVGREDVFPAHLGNENL